MAKNRDLFYRGCVFRTVKMLRISVKITSDFPLGGGTLRPEQLSRIYQSTIVFWSVDISAKKDFHYYLLFILVYPVSRSESLFDYNLISLPLISVCALNRLAHPRLLAHDSDPVTGVPRHYVRFFRLYFFREYFTLCPRLSLCPINFAKVYARR